MGEGARRGQQAPYRRTPKNIRALFIAWRPLSLTEALLKLHSNAAFKSQQKTNGTHRCPETCERMVGPQHHAQPPIRPKCRHPGSRLAVASGGPLARSPLTAQKPRQTGVQQPPATTSLTLRELEN